MSDAPLPPLVRALPAAGIVDEEALLFAFLEYAEDAGLELYPHQEEAALEIMSGSNVILATPTGSGKSLVAEAAHFAAHATGRRSWYTAPIKALVSEKFFALCKTFGSDRVGMITGDAAVNADAPIICCTAEIVANMALRNGPDGDLDVVIMDEFHFYADPQRGWAWQYPLLELSNTQFVLLSATLGPTTFFEDDLTARTGRPTTTISDAPRPVPLDFEYRFTPLHQSLQELLDLDRAPIYLVHFTQRAATEAAQSLTSIDVLTKAEKAALKEEIGGFRFDSPIGKDLKRWLGHGIGVHHAGLLPKYRLLVEKLAQKGVLKIICGTDTLGVGVNVPIRTVLFTQLCKYDGISTRSLNNREFHQIAGRAGRRGFDTQGYVWAQAPAHWIENRQMDEKAATGAKKKKKQVKKKPPERGYSHWDEQTFHKMINGQPEPLRSSFGVNHQMLLELLDREATVVDGERSDGCSAVKKLVTDNHETRKRQRGHIRRSISIYRSLLDAGVIEHLGTPDDLGRTVRVTIDLQQDFALHQPLSLFAVEYLAVFTPEGGQLAPQGLSSIRAGSWQPEAIPAAPPGPPAGGSLRGENAPPEGEDTRHAAGEEAETATASALDVLSVVEAVLEDPGVILAAQADKLKGELIGLWKAQGIEYEERMERLEQVSYPKPLEEELYAAFGIFRRHHPWVGGETVRPKSVARDLYERAMTFREFIAHYGLKRSEGVVLRYLTDAYKALVQNVPEERKTDEVYDITEWLGELVRQVDSSLIDEWERIQNPELFELDEAPIESDERPDVTANRRAFTVMVRNTTFRWVTMLARHAYIGLAEHLADSPAAASGHTWTKDDLESSMAPYWKEFAAILLDGDARSNANFVVDDADPQSWNITQTLVDPEGSNEWVVRARVDLAESRELGEAVVHLEALESQVQ